MRGCRAAGLLFVLVGCASPEADVVWAQPRFAETVALLQSCTGDPTLAVDLLRSPTLTQFAQRTSLPADGVYAGCAGLESTRGIAVTQNAACAPTCAGDDAITCHGPYQVTRHCGAFESVCSTKNGVPTCVDKPSAAPTEAAALCPPLPSTPTCRDNDRLEVCSGYGFQCPVWLADSACSNGQCLLGTACTPGQFLDGLACDGNALRVCVAGRIEKVDCLALGFTGCDPFTRGCSPNPLLAP